MIVVAEIVVGLALLIAGGEGLVRGAVALGRRIGLSPLVVGILIVGVASSMPEMVVSVEAVMVGSPQIAIGNVLGSNISNILLVLALTALVRPVSRQARAVIPDGLALMATAIAFVALGLSGMVTRWQGLAMILVLAGIMGWQFVQTRRETRLARQMEQEQAHTAPQPVVRHPLLASVLVLAGLGALVWGGNLFIGGAEAVAQALGVSKGVIGLTLVALGTSAPELASSLVAARHGHTTVAYGNIVGSNVINILGVGGAAALAGRLTFPPLMARLDGTVMLAATAAMIVLLSTGRGLTRPRAAVLLVGYVTFVVLRSTWLAA